MGKAGRRVGAGSWAFAAVVKEVATVLPDGFPNRKQETLSVQDVSLAQEKALQE